MLECPQCGEPEIKRFRQGNVQRVLFACMLMVTLPADEDDVTLQRQLDEWKRTGGLEAWLKKPMFSEGTDIVVIKDKEIIGNATKRFNEMWEKGKPFTPEKRGGKQKNASKPVRKTVPRNNAAKRS
jgi:hypothetical protein